MNCPNCMNYLDPWETICLNCGNLTKTEAEIQEQEEIDEIEKGIVRELG